MTATVVRSEVRHATSVEQAVGWLAELDGEGAALAGGTWLMRAGLRGETGARVHVALGRVAELHGVGGEAAVVGALTTHAQLAAGNGAAHAALRQAAALSAFPQVRNVATLGGNIAARGFAEADLVPALLALDARLRVAGPEGRSTRDLTEHLSIAAHPPAELIVGVELPAAPDRRSGYARLTVRGGGEYAIASVALAVELDGAGTVRRARVAVGSVEPVARRCPGAEQELLGSPLTPASARAAGAVAAAECRPRDGLDSPGWYRAAVLPALFERAADRARGAADHVEA